MPRSAFVLLACLVACRHAEVRPSAPPTQYPALLAMPSSAPTARVAYGDDALQFGELRLPAGPGPFPLVVLVHGGCWRSAYDLAHDRPAATALTNAGIATWLIEYRRVGDPGGGWPGTFDDIRRAVAYVPRLAERYSIDRSRIALAGHSAGGQLVLWAAAERSSATHSAPADSLTIRAVVGLAPITDMRAYASATGCGSAVVPLLGGTSAQVPERYHATSPVEMDAVHTAVHIVHGAADAIVPPATSRAYVDAAHGRGERATLTVVPGAGHFDLVDPTSLAWSAVLHTIRDALER